MNQSVSLSSHWSHSQFGVEDSDFLLCQHDSRNSFFLFQVSSCATRQWAVQISSPAVKPRRATGLAVRCQMCVWSSFHNGRDFNLRAAVRALMPMSPSDHGRLFVVEISFTAAHLVTNVIHLIGPVRATATLRHGWRKCPPSCCRMSRQGMLCVTPLLLVLMAPPAARYQEEAGPAVLLCM